MNYRDRIVSEPGKRGGRPCLRGTRIAVADVLGWLAAGLSHAEIAASGPASPTRQTASDASSLRDEAPVRPEPQP